MGLKPNFFGGEKGVHLYMIVYTLKIHWEKFHVCALLA